MPEHWVINTSPTILLAKVGLVEFVPQLVTELVIPEPVASEILTAAKGDAAAVWLQGAGKIFIKPAVADLPSLSDWKIGPGERSVISWAATHADYMAVLDDLEARFIAQRLGIKIIGTIGIVLRLKRHGLISEAKPHLKKIREVGGYISEELFHEALRQVGEKT